jgi:hypothetical protein
MKKSLLALAVLSAFAGVASAQSSVQLFGTLDVGGKYLKNDGRSKQWSEETDGINSSEIRFQGIEDLGGGLKAGFNLRSGINPDTGTSNAKFWNRRATVSLYSNCGDLRLGRDYVPTFWTGLFDPFGYNGIGSAGNVRARAGAARQLDRLLPAEQPGRLLRPADGRRGRKRPSGTGRALHRRPVRLPRRPVRHRCCVGPLIAFIAPNSTGQPGSAGETERRRTSAARSTSASEADGATTRTRPLRERDAPFGILPFGQSSAYRLRRQDGPDTLATDLDNIKATYQYNLSKRTACTGRCVPEKRPPRFLPGDFVWLPKAGGDSKGFELGVRHFF